VVERENATGFSLAALTPLDALAEETTRPGTVGYFALFERLADRDCPLMLDWWTLRPELSGRQRRKTSPVRSLAATSFEYEESTTSLLWPGDKETAQRLAAAGKTPKICGFPV